MVWRLAVVAVYVGLAIVIGVAYGVHGLATLSFFYFWSAAWVVFARVWGGAARAAGRWNVDRAEAPPVRRERDGSPPAGGEALAVEQREVGVVRDPLLVL